MTDELNLGDFDDVQEFQLMPEGLNKVMVISGEIKDNSAGTGRYIVVEMQNATGENVRAFFNVEHQNTKAQNIGKAQYKRFVSACGFDNWPSSLAQLTGAELIVDIIHDEYEPGKTSAKVKNYQRIEKIETVKEDSDSIPF